MPTTPPDGGPPTTDADGAPPAPEIPSFASLRHQRSRTAFDVLVPAAAKEDVPPPAADAPPAGPAPAAGPRPATYDDLCRLGLRLARAAAGAPVAVLAWSVRLPVRTLRRLTS